MKTKRTTTADPDFKKLEILLDKLLHKNYNEEMDFYGQHNRFSSPIKCLVIYYNELPIACGGFKENREENFVEIKRMFVHTDHRGNGYGKEVLNGLEDWARELNFGKARLETGIKQTEARALYQKSGYQIIENFDPYKDMPNSICMEKNL